MDDLTMALAAKPRVSLGHFPTPLDEAPRLSERLGFRVLIKRDDQTGLALGGNKVRKLEFLLAEALEQKCDTIITTGGSQSNHARLTAAACRRLGLDCYLILDRGRHPEEQGNILLDELFDAKIQLIESDDPAVAAEGMRLLAEKLGSEGRTTYVIPRGGSVPPGATGYAAFIPELVDQLNGEPVTVYLGTGSTGTHSGVLAGVAAASGDINVQGVSVSRTTDLQVAKVLELSNATLEFLGSSGRVQADRVHVDDRFRGPGYGIPTTGTMEAITIAARDEGLVLDPVYTGKAMAGLIGHAREGKVGEDTVVVFLHTGGAPALFAYNREVAESLGV